MVGIDKGGVKKTNLEKKKDRLLGGNSRGKRKGKTENEVEQNREIEKETQTDIDKG